MQGWVNITGKTIKQTKRKPEVPLSDISLTVKQCQVWVTRWLFFQKKTKYNPVIKAAEGNIQYSTEQADKVKRLMILLLVFNENSPPIIVRRDLRVTRYFTQFSLEHIRWLSL